MAQVGRISGPLLEANLLRKGFTNNTSQDDLKFRNTNDDPVLLKVDVTNGRVGVDVDAPANELHISNTFRTIDLIGDTAGLANFSISTTNINVDTGDITLNAGEHIQLSNLETEQFYASDNFIATKNTNTDIDIDPNGTGTVEVQSNLEVFGSLSATGNITLEGTIIFGDNTTQDTVDINADVNDDIIPDITDTYDLGSVTKRWNTVYTNLLNGQLVTSGTVNVSDIFLESEPGNIIYVAENGLDTNVGGHQTGPLATIQEAISRCDASTSGPIMIFLFPGTYVETCPLVVPDNVTIMGADIRNTVVKPTLATQDKDIFHLGDSSTISNITIKDFYYDSINNTGYALRFAPNAVITNRSPYIQNITVITQGSTTTVDDPRGFAAGDAGRGAWIDGSELNSASIEASMLFHSATFICPNADVINMTNGVRVEWLNSFTYFANRGLYAFNGLTGRTTYDGSTVQYGAELRSIGSANVYGNYGAVADGSDTLMYLIQHNMAYIGSGKYVDNDASRAIYANEVVELNSGKIQFTTTDHLGGFRIGDNFWVDFETGNTTINIDTLSVNQFNALRVNTGPDTTVIDGAYIETGNFEIRNSTISSISGDLNIASATGQINLQDNTNIVGDLAISGDLSYGGVLNIKGNEATDSLVFNVEFEQDFNPHQTLQFDLGSFEKRWLLAHLDRIESADFSIYDNVIETNVSNADLELRANGTGKVYIPNSATFSNALTVNGTTTINSNVGITDPTFTVTGNINQTGSRTVTENVVVGQNINIGAAAQFEEILIDDNFITTTTSNTDLELRASGTGTVNIGPSVEVTNNLNADNIEGQNANVTLNTTADNANIGSIEINDNYIETTGLNEDLILVADRDVVVTGTNTVLGQNLTVQGSTDLQATDVTGLVQHTGNTVQTGNVTLSGEWNNGNIYIEDNFVTTLGANQDLDLRATGNVTIPANDVQINNDLTVSTDTSLQGTTITGSLLHTGDRTQTGNYTQGGELTVDSLYFEDNFITTNESNADLELRAAGLQTTPGELDFRYVEDEFYFFIEARSQGNATDYYVGYNFGTTEYKRPNAIGFSTSGPITWFVENTWTYLDHEGDRYYRGDLVTQIVYDVGPPLLYRRYYFINRNNERLPDVIIGASSIFAPTNNVEIANNLTVNGITSLQNTTITGTVTHTGDRTQTGNYNIAGEISNGNILIEDNFITTTNTNSDLELRASGTGEIVIDSLDTVTINNNLFVGGTLDYQGFLTINGNVLLQGNTQDGSLTVTENFDISGTLDISSQAQFEDVRIEDNFVTTTLSNSDLELRASGTGKVLIPNNAVQINNNLFAASISAVDVNVNNDLVLDELVITDSNIEINENYITTKTSNADLELRATGNVVIQENALIEQDLTVNGNFNLTNSNIVGDLALTGNRIQTGNYSLVGNLNISSLVTDQEFQFDDVRISGNVLETTLSNSNLDLRANGTGDVIFENLRIYNNLTTNTFNVSSINVADSVSLETIELSTDVQFFDNVITTTNSNSNLELRANGTGSIYVQDLEINTTTISTPDNLILAPTENLITNSTSYLKVPVGTAATGILGDIRFNTTDSVFEGTSLSTVTLGGVYSANRATRLLAHPTNNTISLTANNTLVGTVAATGITLTALDVDDIFVNNNSIITNVSNSDLELVTNGTGELVLGNISLVDNIIKNDGSNIIISNTGFGNVKFAGTGAIAVPSGTNDERPDVLTPPQIGDTRWNTEIEILETWDGNQYISAAGVATAITPQEFDDLLLEYTLIFG